jgi:hypothetical protein
VKTRSYSIAILTASALVLPKSEGLLPKWQLIVATMAVFNTIQNFATLKLTRRLYASVPSASSI